MQAIEEADALVVGTEWPEFKQISENLYSAGRTDLIIIDPNRHLQASKQKFIEAGYKYIAVGTSEMDGV
jgi:predicted dinucleotide-binding enzyme